MTLLLPSLAMAEPFAYGSNFFDLYRVDLATAQATRVGAFGTIGPQEIGDVEGLAMAEDGTLYAVSDGLDALLRVDPATGHATLVGFLGIAGQGTGNGGNDFDFGLAFACDGRLWMSSDTTGKLWQVDPATGAATPRGTLGHPITGLASRDDALYGLGGQSDQGLYRIDPDTATATLIGTLQVPGNARVQDAGLDFDADGRLWATLDYNPPPNDGAAIDHLDIVEINPNTGAVITLREMTGAPQGIDTEGLAIAPPQCNGGGPGGGLQLSAVPSLQHAGLATLALLMAGFALLYLARRG